MMEQVPERKSKLENKSTYFDPSTLSCLEAVTYIRRETIAAMTDVHVQDAFPCKQ